MGALVQRIEQWPSKPPMRVRFLHALLIKEHKMGWIGLLITVVCYLIAALDFYKQERIGMTIAFVAYALANIGFIYELVKK